LIFNLSQYFSCQGWWKCSSGSCELCIFWKSSYNVLFHFKPIVLLDMMQRWRCWFTWTKGDPLEAWRVWSCFCSEIIHWPCYW
jgi:hypothetical protein